jgi:large subunit ribosomal protein L15
MQIHEVKRRHKTKYKKIVGRGGKRGTTSGKGTKGQASRSGRKLRPEVREMLKRIPKLRGRGKNSLTSIEVRPDSVNLSDLEIFADGAIISPKTLLAHGLVRKIGGKIPKVKVLASGELTKKLKFVDCMFSVDVIAKIEKAGGVIKN